MFDHLFPVERDQQPNHVTKYKKYEHIFNKELQRIEFPIKVHYIKKFVDGVNKDTNASHSDFLSENKS